MCGIILTFKLNATPAIKGRPGRTTRVERYTYTQFHAVGQQHWPEGEGVWTYWSDQEGWDFGVNERATSGELGERSVTDR